MKQNAREAVRNSAPAAVLAAFAVNRPQVAEPAVTSGRSAGERNSNTGLGNGTSCKPVRTRKSIAGRKKGGKEGLALPSETTLHSQIQAISPMDSRMTLLAQGSTAPYARGAKTIKKRVIERIARSHRSDCNDLGSWQARGLAMLPRSIIFSSEGWRVSAGVGS